jgi:putative hydrolase of the HAD superfamily
LTVGAQRRTPGRTVWLFDLDNTLHDASHSVYRDINAAMTQYIVDHVGVDHEAASRLRVHYWHRYGATLMGLVRHHGVKASHFLEETHRLPGMEARLRLHLPDRHALASLPGRLFILTNAPRSYALRVLDTLRLTACFEGIVTIDEMRMFGQHRPKPDARMLRALAARLGVHPSDCVLVEDTLDHQRSARRIGMRTVWMQRYLRPRGPGAGAPRRCTKPPYVCARIFRVKELHGRSGSLAKGMGPR